MLPGGKKVQEILANLGCCFQSFPALLPEIATTAQQKQQVYRIMGDEGINRWNLNCPGQHLPAHG